MTKCQHCKTRNAIWRVGRDGFGAKAGAKVCNGYGCQTWATNGYPVTMYRLEKPAEEAPQPCEHTYSIIGLLEPGPAKCSKCGQEN